MTLEQYKDFSNAFIDACKKDGYSLILEPHGRLDIISHISARNGSGCEICFYMHIDGHADLGFGIEFRTKTDTLYLAEMATKINTFEDVLSLKYLKKNIKFFLLSNLNLIG